MFSILYLLIYMCTNQIPFEDSSLNGILYKRLFIRNKIMSDAKKACNDPNSPFITFAEEVYALKFDEKPDY